ncbi:MAG: hypothetical protein O2816_08235 [Planctomycetota bacterium]|nr:hypothetical protein [Planctomycetota bacterium]
MSRLDRVSLNNYVLLPLTVVGASIACYFSGVPLLQDLAAPAANREFGLIENLQHLILLGVALTAFAAARRGASGRPRLCWWVITLGATLVFLEELDYGQHWVRLANGDPTPGEPVNLHNQGQINEWLRRGSDLGMFLVFGLLPILVRRPRPDWVPSPWSLATLVLGFLLSQLAHRLDAAGIATNEALTHNISEFRETVTYWVVALYVFERNARGSGGAPPEVRLDGRPPAPGT